MRPVGTRSTYRVFRLIAVLGCRRTPGTPRESPGVRTETVRPVANRSGTRAFSNAKNQQPVAEIANPGVAGTVVADFVDHAIGEEDGGPSTVPRPLTLKTAGAMDTTLLVADAEAVLFSVKSFAAAIIAYYISLRIGFAQPVWAVTTAYLVSQPLAGAVVSKALFRVLGTFLGAAAAVALLPPSSMSRSSSASFWRCGSGSASTSAPSIGLRDPTSFCSLATARASSGFRASSPPATSSTRPCCASRRSGSAS